MSGTRTITSTATQNKNKTKRLTHNKNKTAEAQLTDSFGEALCLGLAPRSGREQQKLHSKAAPELIGSTDQHQLGDQSNPFALHPPVWGASTSFEICGQGIQQKQEAQQKNNKSTQRL
ncbi:hypothetical protein [Pseudomonas carassii]|uniref:Uncharacterized protein n=1 Tax=Pseudomonas carassii TaxID=3115855 RepID=A0ABU7HCY4_9PSED|nr:hypothetical protein [Pseudomonas sp. 137P]MEE1889124.1 hypothetical protein [Pseudomonas sp. 137P]